VTTEGIRLLAEVAMLFAALTYDENLSAPEDCVGWITLFALTSAARMPEAISFTPHLPFHQRPNDAT